MTDLLKTIEDPEIFADIAAFNLCKNAMLKQKLLETLDVNRRLGLLMRALRSEVDAAILQLKLLGGPSDDDVRRN
jgi:ATP-dependent Lon protease